jgi:hypothetical protein
MLKAKNKPITRFRLLRKSQKEILLQSSVLGFWEILQVSVIL